MITFDVPGNITIAGKVYPGSYSGHGEGLNNPAMESVHGVGRLPRGRYKIDVWHDEHHLGKCVAHLIPVGHDAHGRTALFWHGDNAQMNHTASDGCVVSPYDVRDTARKSGDTDFLVE